ncbi:MAG: glycosyltransferase [Verrucomicrobia bacterium]|nr:MAG: glycosyltransferase [Verrucomicrobiota bacterium]
MNGSLLYLSRGDSSEVPHGEICLPALAKAGWEIEVVAPGATNSLLDSVRPYPHRARELPRGGFKGELAMLRELLSARFGSYDLIYIHSQSLSARAYLALLGPLFGKKLVYHNPDYYDPFNHPFYFWLERRFCRKLDLYLNNEFHRAYLTRAAYGVKCPIVTVPIMLPACWPFPKPDAELRREMAGGHDDAFVLILHGGYGEIRMTPELFEAMRLLPENFRLVMFDRDHRKAEVDRKLDELGIANRVVRYPRMNVRQLARYTMNADAGVLLYQNNDLGNFFTAPGRLTEYVGAGLPVIATNHTALENLVWRYNLGMTTDSTKPAELAEGIRKLAEMRKKNQFPAEVLRQTFLDKLAFDHWEPGIVQQFDDLISGKPSAGGPPPFPWLAKP